MGMCAVQRQTSCKGLYAPCLLYEWRPRLPKRGESYTNLITVSILKRVKKIHRALLWYLQKFFSCRLSQNRISVFRPLLNDRINARKSYGDTAGIMYDSTYVSENCYLDGFQIRCWVRRKFMVLFFSLWLYFIGTNGLLCPWLVSAISPHSL